MAVDDTIHFLSKFKFELNKGQDIHAAIQTTMRETGKAIIITTIILFFGFIVLLHSDIKEVFYQGLLVGIMLITALIADLFLLPVLLIVFLGRKEEGGS
ncbi:MAG: MMPL family transporter [Bacteroidales bacterium]|nr:MMPL family transporter [Bacteroidales bacterium]